jgi:hypothetical protein
VKRRTDGVGIVPHESKHSTAGEGRVEGTER